MIMIGVDIVLYGFLAAWLDNIIPTGKRKTITISIEGTVSSDSICHKVMYG
jgi:hypothetical protein